MDMLLERAQSHIPIYMCNFSCRWILLKWMAIQYPEVPFLAEFKTVSASWTQVLGHKPWGLQPHNCFYHLYYHNSNILDFSINKSNYLPRYLCLGITFKKANTVAGKRISLEYYVWYIHTWYVNCKQ